MEITEKLKTVMATISTMQFKGKNLEEPDEKNTKIEEIFILKQEIQREKENSLFLENKLKKKMEEDAKQISETCTKQLKDDFFLFKAIQSF